MIGSGENGQLTFIDLLGILSFAVGLQNLDLNVNQNDMDAQTRDLDARVDAHIRDALAEIHRHLQEQDAKIDTILNALGVHS